MDKRNFGKTGLKVAPVCYGTWEVGGYPFYKNQNKEDSISILKLAFDRGINFFDTAPVYGFGHAEKLIGKALGAVRDRASLNIREEDIKSIVTVISSDKKF